MKAVVIEEPDRVSVKPIVDPIPEVSDAIIKLEACGICGTDIRILPGAFALTRYRIVPGPELCGEVVALGADVRKVFVLDELTNHLGARQSDEVLQVKRVHVLVSRIASSCFASVGLWPTSRPRHSRQTPC